MTEEKAFRLRYTGSRFAGARLPVEVLSDMPAFRDLLVAYAKDEWRKQNAGRSRVPKGFDKSISMDLVAIETGSAVSKLSWNRATAQARLPGFADELEVILDASFGDAMSLFDSAELLDAPTSLSTEHVRALNKMGAGLRDDERIEFVGTKGRDGNVVFLDNVRRRRLITNVRETYQSRLEDTGRLLGSSVPAESGEGHVIVSTTSGELTIPVDADRVKKEFDGNIHSEVQFDLQVELDHADRIRGVVEVFGINLIDAEIGAQLSRCRSRLNELSGLKEGWLDGAGEGIAAGAVASAHILLTKRPALAMLYRIYPTESGGVLFEFESNGWDLAVEFGVGGGAELYGVQIDGDGEIGPRQFDAVTAPFLEKLDESTLGRGVK